MKMRNFLVLLALGMVAINAWGQEEKAKNIQLSVTPYSFMNKATYQTLELDEYKIHYKSTIGFNLGYEFNIGKATTLAELSYAKAKIDDVTFKPKEEGHEQAFDGKLVFKDLSSFTFMYYWGSTALPGKRVQIPFYLGLGGEVLQGYPFHHFMFDLGAKLRVKFYATNRLGVFVGGTGRWGFGTSNFGNSGNSKSSTHHRTVINLDAGIMYMIN